MNANPLDAAADIMDFLVVQHVVDVRLKTVIIPTTLNTLILRRRMTLKIKQCKQILWTKVFELS